MKLLSPGFLWLLFLAIPIIVLYFLKLKRKPKYVASTLLWEKTIEDMRVNAPFQKLKRSLLLFIQLLILLFVVLSLARPANDVDKFIGNRKIFMLDTSASMKTIEREFDETRFEISRKKIREAIAGLENDEMIALITFDSRAQLIQPFTSEKSIFLKSLENVKPTDCPTSIEEALGLAESLSLKHENVEISVVSDGRFQPGQIPIRFKKLNLKFVSIGSEFDNVGITNFAASISPSSRTQYDLTITLFNSGNDNAKGIVEILHNGNLINAKKFDLESEAEEFYTITDDRLTTGTVEANILRADQFLTDNTATLILPKPRKVKILLVSESNFFLETVLSVASSAIREIEIQAETAKTEEGLQIYESASNRYDLIIFDMCSPKVMNPGNYIFLGAVPPLNNWSLNVDKLVKGPEPKPPVNDPILNNLDLSNVFIKAAPILLIPTDAKILIDSEETPLVAMYTQKGLKIVTIGFDIYDSNWFLQSSFPVFMRNLILNLTLSEDKQDQYTFRTSDSVSIFAGDDDNNAELKSPHGDGKSVILGNDGYWHLGQLLYSGTYELNSGGSSKKMAVSLLNHDESIITPKKDLYYEGKTENVSKETLKDTREYWHLLLLIAFILILVEWFFYHRRPFG